MEEILLWTMLIPAGALVAFVAAGLLAGWIFSKDGSSYRRF